jgi:hypothetical protein
MVLHADDSVRRPVSAKTTGGISIASVFERERRAHGAIPSMASLRRRLISGFAGSDDSPNPPALDQDSPGRGSARSDQVFEAMAVVVMPHATCAQIRS